jgi:hypothetical protein
MSEFDIDLDLAAPIVSEAEKRGLTREQAIEEGRKLGEEAGRPEEPAWAQDRVKRAMAYAAWEYDGKKVGDGARYRKEFGIAEPAMSDPRVSTGSDFLVERK